MTSRLAGVLSWKRAVVASLREHVPWRPGVHALLAELRAEGIPCAIATTSSHEMASLVAEAAPEGAITVVVGSEDVAQTKPSPEPYLRAAELLGVLASDCVAFEDSANGLASAIASGAASVAVPNDAVLPQSGDFITWPTLEGRSTEDLVMYQDMGDSSCLKTSVTLRSFWCRGVGRCRHSPRRVLVGCVR